MLDDLKSALVMVLIAFVFAATFVGVFLVFNVQTRFTNQVARDVQNINRMTAAQLNQAGRMEDFDPNDIDAYLDDMVEQQKAMAGDYDRIARRYGAKRNVAAKPTTEVRTARRVDGAFYPEDLVEPEEETPWMAAGVAGAGGLLVFGLAGLGAYTLLSSKEEEEGEAGEGVETEQAVEASEDEASEDEGADQDVA